MDELYEELLRQAGLTGRYLTTGTVGLASAFANPLAYLANRGLEAAGAEYRFPEQYSAFNDLLTEAGVPEPEGSVEKGVGFFSELGVPDPTDAARVTAGLSNLFADPNMAHLIPLPFIFNRAGDDAPDLVNEIAEQGDKAVKMRDLENADAQNIFDETGLHLVETPKGKELFYQTNDELAEIIPPSRQASRGHLDPQINEAQEAVQHRRIIAGLLDQLDDPGQLAKIQRGEIDEVLEHVRDIHKGNWQNNFGFDMYGTREPSMDEMRKAWDYVEPNLGYDDALESVRNIGQRIMQRRGEELTSLYQQPYRNERLGDVYKHPELEAIIPEIFDLGMNNQRNLPGALGWMDHNKGEIAMAMGSGKGDAFKPYRDFDWEGTLVHEVEHGIQGKTGQYHGAWYDALEPGGMSDLPIQHMFDEGDIFAEATKLDPSQRPAFLAANAKHYREQAARTRLLAYQSDDPVRQFQANKYANRWEAKAYISEAAANRAPEEDWWDLQRDLFNETTTARDDWQRTWGEAAAEQAKHRYHQDLSDDLPVQESLNSIAGVHDPRLMVYRGGTDPAYGPKYGYQNWSPDWNKLTKAEADKLPWSERGVWHPVGLDTKMNKPWYDMTRKVETVNEPRSTPLHPESLRDAYLIGLLGDRTDAGKWLTGVGDLDLENRIRLEGGRGFMWDNPEAVWASGGGYPTRIKKALEEADRLGKRPVGAYMPQAHKTSNFNNMLTDTVLEMTRSSHLPPQVIKKFDDELKALRPEWKGINHPDSMKALETNGELRHQFNYLVGLKRYQEEGFPNIAEARAAITDPALMHTPIHETGHGFGEFTGGMIENPSQPHRTYAKMFEGDYLGEFDQGIPRDVFWRDWAAERGGKTYNQRTSSAARQFPTQVVDDEWIETILRVLESRQ